MTRQAGWAQVADTGRRQRRGGRQTHLLVVAIRRDLSKMGLLGRRDERGEKLPPLIRFDETDEARVSQLIHNELDHLSDEDIVIEITTALSMAEEDGQHHVDWDEIDWERIAAEY